ncbi:TetR/AcrR family transcriptional regulator [Streptomyces sp. NBC_00344]|uniref:TetR/AcrR family transcriptional regulator n=1 Tax=Streptomyces sp. NBC_00344 TaxID=2975720 RepID=UPI002E2200AF
MPAARESLLDSALSAITAQPWSGVRMVDVASAAGVSRQTLYNEFGSKDGLVRALVRREADRYLLGVDRVLAGPAPDAERLAGIAEWTVSAARSCPLVRALLTGCWPEGLPAPRPAARSTGSHIPAQRRADAGPPSPAGLIAAVLRRAAPAPAAGRTEEEAAAFVHHCEVAVRLALSHVVAPGGPQADHLVRDVLAQGG